MSSTPRFFVAPDAIQGEVVRLPSEAAHHARNVLRLRPGERILVHDGLGMAYDCILQEGAGKAAVAQVTASGPVLTEPRTHVIIAQALPKTPDKAEQVLQHGTEVGATGFLLFGARRSVARLSEGEKIEKRLSRWRDIVRGAAEQSGRGLLPSVGWHMSSEEMAGALSGHDAALVLHEGAPRSLRATLNSLPGSATRIIVVVGPEGGLAEEEVALFGDHGGRAVTLGPRVLRTETAALVGLAQILYALEE
jgi:16S rRNA (uracil1498-N3)-methyltransferase